MSGIVGIVQQNGVPVDRALLDRLTRGMAFRGPDTQKTWTEGPVGFGHAMLRTTREAEREQQPGSLDGAVWIVADARVDARDELIEELRRKGHRVPRGAPDAELLLRAYHAWGEACVEHLLGDFAFAIWDGRRKRLFCVRDHFGIKPFFYAEVADGLVFGNTFDCVRRHPGISGQLNDLAIADFLLWEANTDPSTTALAGVRRLPPGHTLSCSENGLRKDRYWTLPAEELIRYRQAEEYVEHFADLLRVAVTDRLRTTHVGVLMSGGLDSTSVAAVAHQELARQGRAFDLRAYTVDYRPLFADEEGRYAQMVAEKIGIPLHVTCGANSAPYQDWDRQEPRWPEPLHEPTIALQRDQFRQIQAHGRVALTGDGGDIVLHGQSWPYLKTLCAQREFGRLATEVSSYVLKHGRIPPLLGGFRTRMRHTLGVAAGEPQYPEWLNPELERRLRLRERWMGLSQPAALAHPVRPMAYELLTSGLIASAHEAQDAGVTGLAVDVRSPLIDLRLVMFLLRLPPIPWCADKHLLRTVMRGLLPEPVRRRPKTPLAGDPHYALERRERQKGQRVLAAEPALLRYVEASRISRFAPDMAPETVMMNLRPVSLSYWLQKINALDYPSGMEVGDEGSRNAGYQEALSDSEPAGVRLPH